MRISFGDICCSPHAGLHTTGLRSELQKFRFETLNWRLGIRRGHTSIIRWTLGLRDAFVHWPRLGSCAGRSSRPSTGAHVRRVHFRAARRSVDAAARESLLAALGESIHFGDYPDAGIAARGPVSRRIRQTNSLNSNAWEDLAVRSNITRVVRRLFTPFGLEVEANGTDRKS